MRHYRRRRSKRAEDEVLGSLFVLGIIGASFLFIARLFQAAYQLLIDTWATTSGKFWILTSVIVPSAIWIVVASERAKRLKKAKEEYELEMSKVQVSDRRQDYIIERPDYKRGNPKENVYRKMFQLQLFHIYQNACAKCRRNDNGVDIDHFFFSKNEGGNFIMRHVNGHLVNNAVPLCHSCNRSKSDRDYKAFYSEQEILSLFRRNAEMTRLLNQRGILDSEGKVVRSQGNESVG